MLLSTVADVIGTAPLVSNVIVADRNLFQSLEYLCMTVVTIT